MPPLLGPVWTWQLPARAWRSVRGFPLSPWGSADMVTGTCPGTGPMSSPQSAPAWARSVKFPSPAAIIASAISPGPPIWSKRHRIPSRSSGCIPGIDAAASHSSSFRHAIVTESAVMLPAMALPGSPSIPAVMTVLGSMTANPARTQSEVSWLSGPGPGTNPARKILATVSSSRHPMSLACSSLGADPGSARNRATFSGLSPIHASSVSDSSESNAEVSSAWTGASIPEGTGVAVGSGAVVAVGSGVGLGAVVAVAVGNGVAVSVSAGAGAVVAVGALVMQQRRIDR